MKDLAKRVKKAMQLQGSYTVTPAEIEADWQKRRPHDGETKSDNFMAWCQRSGWQATRTAGGKVTIE